MVAISVIMPVRNARPFIDQALLNLRNLRFADYEIIVVDDASTDGTSQALAEARETHELLKIIRLESQAGSGNARNVGLAQATGAYVWFVDVDDLWDPTILQVMHTLVTRHNADIAICAARVVDQDGRRLGSISPPFDGAIAGHEALDLLLLGKLEGHTWNKLIRRSLADAKPFPPLPTHQDLAAMIGILANAKKVLLTRDILYCYLRHSNSSLNRRDRVHGGQLSAVESLRRDVPTQMARELPRSHVAYFVSRHILISSVRDLSRARMDDRRRRKHHLSRIRTTRKEWDLSSLYRSRWILTGVEAHLAVTCPNVYGYLYRWARSAGLRGLSVARQWTNVFGQRDAVSAARRA